MMTVYTLMLIYCNLLHCTYKMNATYSAICLHIYILDCVTTVTEHKVPRSTLQHATSPFIKHLLFKNSQSVHTIKMEP